MLMPPRFVFSFKSKMLTCCTQQVVLAEKPLISEESAPLEKELLDELVGQMSTLASVYHKPPEAFVSKLKKKVRVFDPSKADAKAARRLDKQEKRRAALGTADSAGDDDRASDSDSSTDEPSAAGGEGTLIQLDNVSAAGTSAGLDPLGLFSQPAEVLLTARPIE
jgi:AP-1 complex subunit beta-1